MEKIKQLKENLISVVEAQMAKGLDNVKTEELGDAIDMIKDIEEALYYCSIVKAMEEREEDEKYRMKHQMNYPMYYSPMMYNDGGSMGGGSRNYNGGMYNYANNGGGSRNYDGDGRMYYNGSNSGGNDARGGGTRGYSDGWVMAPFDMRDYREGKSPMTRRTYMESKELHHGKEKQMQELEKYMNELSQDITEMINDASPEEKTVLSQKLSALSQKIR